MELEKRLRELRESGEANMAKTLAKGALSSQHVEDITVTETGVEVETQDFKGMHSTKPKTRILLEQSSASDETVDADEITVQLGTYRLKAGKYDYKITDTNVHREEIGEYLEEGFSLDTTDKREFWSEHPSSRGNLASDSSDTNEETDGTPTKISDGGVQRGVVSRIVLRIQDYRRR